MTFESLWFKSETNTSTFCWVCWLIFVYCRLNITEGGRRSTLLQDTDGITELICKLNRKQNQNLKQYIVDNITGPLPLATL